MKYFDEEGYLTDEFYKKVSDKGATGNEALMYLAGEFAGETHGNYNAETLFMRVGEMKGTEIVIKSRKERLKLT